MLAELRGTRPRNRPPGRGNCACEELQTCDQKGTSEMHGNSAVPVAVEGSGEGVVAHVGLHALGALADRLRLGDSLSARVAVTGERRPVHDRGKVLTPAMLMLAGGGEACADIEHLRSQEALFGSVPSDSTLYRTFRQVDPGDADRPVGCNGRGPRPGVASSRSNDWDRHGGVGHRRVVASDPLREQGRGGRELQGRLRVPPDLLLRRRDR